MGNKLPSAKPDRVIRALEACGLRQIRQTGSHTIFTKPGLRRPVVVARHRRELGPKAIAKILHQAEVSQEDFRAKL